MDAVELPLNSPYANGKPELEGSTPNLASVSPMRPASEGKVQSGSDNSGALLPGGSPSSGLRGVSGMSQISSLRNSLQPVDQQQISELPEDSVGRASSDRRLSDLPEKPHHNVHST